MVDEVNRQGWVGIDYYIVNHISTIETDDTYYSDIYSSNKEIKRDDTATIITIKRKVGQKKVPMEYEFKKIDHIANQVKNFNWIEIVYTYYLNDVVGATIQAFYQIGLAGRHALTARELGWTKLPFQTLACL